MYPTDYDYKSKNNQVPNTLCHMVWECDHDTYTHTPVCLPTAEQWKHQLTSASLEDQSRPVDKARLAARDHGILD